MGTMKSGSWAPHGAPLPRPKDVPETGSRLFQASGGTAGFGVPGASVAFSRRALFASLVATAAFFIALSLIQDILVFGFGVAGPEAKVWRLDVDVEQSFYTWFSSSLILVNAALLGLIAVERRALGAWDAKYWLALAVIFVLLSADESISLHEWMSGKLSRFLDTGGFFYFAWLLPAVAACIIAAGIFFPFLRRIPTRPRVWLMMAAAVFLAGAVGMEALAGKLVEGAGVENLPYRLLATAEETMEGLGMIMCLYALMLFRDAKTGAAPPQEK